MSPCMQMAGHAQSASVLLHWLNMAEQTELKAVLNDVDTENVMAARGARRLVDEAALPLEQQIKLKVQQHIEQLHRNWIQGTPLDEGWLHGRPGVHCLQATLAGLHAFVEQHGRELWRLLSLDSPINQSKIEAHHSSASEKKRPRMGWGNCNEDAWNKSEDEGYFEVLKAFCAGGGGHKQKTRPEQGDVTLLGNIMGHCKQYSSYLPKEKAGKLTDVRNQMMHHPMQLLTKRELRTMVGGKGHDGHLLSLLTHGPSIEGSLGKDQSAKAAVATIREILAWTGVTDRQRNEGMQIWAAELEVMQQALKQTQDQLLAEHHALQSSLAVTQLQMELKLGEKLDRDEFEVRLRSLSQNLSRLSPGGVAEQLSTLSLDPGDLGYFFPRIQGLGWLRTGSIVALCDGKLMCPGPEVKVGALYLVVSDECVLVRAGRLPCGEEEGPKGTGHWVAWVGQVPTRVRGPISAGDWIGADAEGHVGVRVEAGNPGAVGVALEASTCGDSESIVLAGLSFAQSTIGHAIGGVTSMVDHLKEKVDFIQGQVQEIIQGKKRALSYEIDDLSYEIKELGDESKRIERKKQRVEQRRTVCYMDLHQLTNGAFALEQKSILVGIMPAEDRKKALHDMPPEERAAIIAEMKEPTMRAWLRDIGAEGRVEIVKQLASTVDPDTGEELVKYALACMSSDDKDVVLSCLPKDTHTKLCQMLGKEKEMLGEKKEMLGETKEMLGEASGDLGKASPNRRAPTPSPHLEMLGKGAGKARDTPPHRASIQFLIGIVRRKHNIILAQSHAECVLDLLGLDDSIYSTASEEFKELVEIAIEGHSVQSMHETFEAPEVLDMLPGEELAKHAEPLLARLEDSNEYVRQAATEVLCKLPGEELAKHAEPLLARLEDNNEYVRYYCSLDQVASRAAGPAGVAVGAQLQFFTSIIQVLLKSVLY